MKIKILNQQRELILDFDDKTGNEMRKCIENCIESPNEYPSITYEDKKDTIILTSEYLRASLIVISKK